MAAVRKASGSKLVAALCVVAVVVCAAGMRHQRVQQEASVDWRQVSIALMEVEKAKRELHDSMQQRLLSEQQAVSLRQK